MFKKLIISGLVLLVTGAAVLGWVINEKSKVQKKAAQYQSKYGSEPDKYLKLYTEWLQAAPESRAYLPWGLDENGKPKTEARLQQEQQERLEADLDKLAAGKNDTFPFADILYGQNWRQELNEYKKQKKTRENIFTASLACAFTGGGVIACGLLLWIGQILTKASSRLKKTVTGGPKSQVKNKKPAQTNTKPKIKPNAKVIGKVMAEPKAVTKAKAEEKTKPSAEKLVKAKENTGAKARRIAKAEAEKLARAEEKARAKAEAEEKIRAKAEAKAKAKAERKAQVEAKKLAKVEAKAKAKAKAKEKVEVESVREKEGTGTLEQKDKQQGLQDQKKNSKVLLNSGWRNVNADSADPDEQPLPKTTCTSKSENSVKNPTQNVEETAVIISEENSIDVVESPETTAENVNVSPKLEDSLKTQTENMEKQMAEFKQMAQGVRQTAIDHSQPINNTLSELTQQVSAIREYASSQQDRLKKLQDGYDWSIMRTFCIRVIRCIDNLERRISQMKEQDVEVEDLEEIRDEMLFALESSGVEQFEPEINSDYHGQEKYAEAVKEKEQCDDSKHTGKIAQVIRPGYQYFIDEENAKVVRPAQVKLFS